MSDPSFIAFDGLRRVAEGSLASVIERCKILLDADPSSTPIVYDEATGRPVDVDYRGNTPEVLARIATPEPDAAAKRGPGRPKLGVVAREVTLLPRHWAWLADQRGGASVALRRLVEAASREAAPADRLREAREAVDRFMYVLAGNLPGYEEASRAFHRLDQARFDSLIEPWPADVRDHIRKLAAAARGPQH
ncbi:hypothetical protein EC912_106129 [Luteibacter rhizovicinus]|uniref:DUF2239 family protein n=1 Tax=Luteibacter rhizovicinus TaxID=242606 RepID=A0A4R3YKL8_9GAMM|nr:DUF2239 family protein [Luteibacter rhizovicinus]TCV92790.1 hypothetical protein EC912_106129 [Luteibacter rhizovicinus]